LPYAPPQYHTPLLRTHWPGVLFGEDETELHAAATTMPIAARTTVGQRSVIISAATVTVPHASVTRPAPVDAPKRPTTGSACAPGVGEGGDQDLELAVSLRTAAATTTCGRGAVAALYM
jgi:hypothetical protein